MTCELGLCEGSVTQLFQKYVFRRKPTGPAAKFPVRSRNSHPCRRQRYGSRFLCLSAGRDSPWRWRSIRGLADPRKGRNRRSGRSRGGLFLTIDTSGYSPRRARSAVCGAHRSRPSNGRIACGTGCSGKRRLRADRRRLRSLWRRRGRSPCESVGHISHLCFWFLY